jgi:acyl carrier protein
MTSENHFKDPSAGATHAQVAPQTMLQQVLSAVWAESLGIDNVGIEDDFFELGGASVVATQVVSRLREMFQMDLPAILLFEAPTIEKFAGYMIEHEARPGLTEKTATLLKQIEGMTEEEVAHRLGSK